MASNSREEILAHALDIIRGGGAISFDSVAQSSGLSKPGLMYHFRTKEALMLGLVDHVADEWQREMDARLTSPFQGSTMRERAGIYVEACVTREPDPADIVMLTDPRLRQELTARWAERISTWFMGLEQLALPERGYIAAVRLLADGAWFAGATGINIPTPDERAVILAAAYELLSKVEA